MTKSFHSTSFANLVPVPEDSPGGIAFPRSHADLERVPMDPLAVTSRKQRVMTIQSKGPTNAWNFYPDDIEYKQVVKQRGLLFLADHIPHLGMKRSLIRNAGVKLGNSVSIDMNVLFTPVFTHYIEIEDEAILGAGCLIASHQYGVNNYEIGRVRVGRQALVGAMSVVAPGVVIGEGAALGPGSVATRDIPPYEFWAGVPARRVADHRP